MLVCFKQWEVLVCKISCVQVVGSREGEFEGGRQGSAGENLFWCIYIYIYIYICCFFES